MRTGGERGGGGALGASVSDKALAPKCYVSSAVILAILAILCSRCCSSIEILVPIHSGRRGEAGGDGACLLSGAQRLPLILVTIILNKRKFS